MNIKVKAIIISLIMIITSNTANIGIYAEEAKEGTKEEITRERIIEEELSEGLRDELMDEKDVHSGYLDKKLIETSDLIIRGIEQYKKSTDKIKQLAMLKKLAKESFAKKYNKDIEKDFYWIRKNIIA